MYRHKFKCLNHRNLSISRFSFSTVNSDEIDHFSKLHNQWWNKQGEMKPLHSMNKVRVKFITGGLVNSRKITEEQSKVPKPLTSLKLLDVGCGGGILSEALARLGADVTGIDASSVLIDTAKSHAALDSSLCNNLNYVCSSIEDHSNANSEVYDAVVASEILEHVPEKKIFLQSCALAIKPGGSVFVTTLNRTGASYIASIILAEYVLNILSKGTHDWNNFCTPEELECMLESSGCPTLLVNGLFYNAATNNWTWTRNTSINYALQAVKRSN